VGPEDLPHPNVGVVHAPFLGQHIGNSLGRPEIGIVSEGLCSSSQEPRKRLELLRCQSGGSPRSRAGSETPRASTGGALSPVVDCLRRDSKAVSHLGLTHTSPKKIKGTKAPFLERRGVPMLLSPSTHERAKSTPGT
jgi:hypothetical protein